MIAFLIGYATGIGSAIVLFLLLAFFYSKSKINKHIEDIINNGKD